MRYFRVTQLTSQINQTVATKRWQFALLGMMLLCSTLARASVADPAIDGYWQHPKDPVWIEINLTAGTGTAVRHDEQPETVGFHVVKALTAAETGDAWKGQVFVPQVDAYKDVVISLPDSDTLRMTVKFGFIRRSLEWSRVDVIEKVRVE